MRYTLLCCLLAICLFSPAQINVEWSFVHRVPGEMFGMPEAIEVDASNHVYLAGHSLEQGRQHHHVTVYKLDPSGNVVWSTRDTTISNVLGMVEHNGEVFLMGSYGGTNAATRLIGLDSTGTESWRVSSLYPNLLANRGVLELTATGELAFGIQRHSDTNPADFVVGKYDLNGNQLWNNIYTEPGDHIFFDLATDAQGNIFVTGMGNFVYDALNFTYAYGVVMMVKFDGGGAGILWDNPFTLGWQFDHGTGVEVSPNGDPYVLGWGQNQGVNNIRTMRYDGGTGGVIWSDFYPSQSLSWGKGIAVNDTSAFFAGIASDSSIGITPILKGYDSNGLSSWQYSRATANPVGTWEPTDLSFDDAGNLVCIGYYSDDPNNYDSWVEVHSPQGTLLGELVFRDSSNAWEIPRCIKTGSAGVIYLSGLGVPSLGQTEFMVTKLNAAATTTDGEIDSGGLTMEVFPNPLQEEATLLFSEPVPPGTVLNLYNDLGQMVREQSVVGQSTVISKGSLSAGVYFVRVLSPQGPLGSTRLLVR